MEGLIIKIPVAVSDSTLPKLPVITNNGTLLLLDNNRDMVDISSFKASLDAATSGNVTLPLVNRASNIAVSLGILTGTGISIISESGYKVSIAETTLKGGLHIKVAGAAGSLDDLGARLYLESGLVSYLQANKAHHFFGSIWARTTGIGAGLVYLLKIGYNSNNNFLNVQGTVSLGDGPDGIDRTGNSLALGLIKGTAAGAFTIRESGQGTSIVNSLIGWRTANPTQGALPAMIVYRVYIEDLTVSGRTYAQCKADDDALHSAAFGSGGRLDGDTWTDPATL